MLGGLQAVEETLNWIVHLLDLRNLQDTLAAGKVIPGFGHGVLRNTDPFLGMVRAQAALLWMVWV